MVFKSAVQLCARHTGRIGPSGQALRGAEQRATPVQLPHHVSANMLHTPAIEIENVHRVYDQIAHHWDSTRYKAWPRVEEFIRKRPPGSLIADLGCGNGKNIPAVKEAQSFPVASDVCVPLAQIAAKAHGTTVVVADCLNSPFRGGIFDAAISIAILHHLSTEQRRVQALREAARLLKPGGELLVYCWSYEQDAEVSRSRHRFTAQDVLVPFHHRNLRAKKKKGDRPADASTAVETSANSSWQESAQVYQRYCHVYRDGELVQLLAKLPQLEILECYYDTGNWCAVARRTSASVS